VPCGRGDTRVRESAGGRARARGEAECGGAHPGGHAPLEPVAGRGRAAGKPLVTLPPLRGTAEVRAGTQRRGPPAGPDRAARGRTNSPAAVPGCRALGFRGGKWGGPSGPGGAEPGGPRWLLDPRSSLWGQTSGLRSPGKSNWIPGSLQPSSAEMGS
jgi:hypothetical protein